MATKIEQLIELVGDEQVRSRLERLGQTGQKAMDDVGKSSEKASASTAKLGPAAEKAAKGVGDLASNVIPLPRGVQAATRSINDLTGSLGPLGKALGAIALTVATAGGAMFELARRGAAAASEVKEAGTRAGVSGQDFRKLGFAFQQSGASAQTFERAVGVIFEAAERGGESAKVFEELGLDVKELAKDPVKALSTLADRIASIEDPAKRASTVVGLFGRRAGAQMVELLSGGSKAIKELTDEAQRLGLVFTEAELAIGKRFGDTLNALNQSVQTTTDKIGLAFIPLFDPLLRAFGELSGRLQPVLVRFANSITQGLQPIFDDLTKAFSGRSQEINNDFIFVLVRSFQFLGETFATVVRNISAGVAILSTVFSTLVQAVTTPLRGVIKIFDELFAQFNKLTGFDFSAAKITGFLISAVIGIRALVTAVTAARTAFGLLRVAMIAVSATPIGLFLTGLAVLLTILIARLNPEQWRAFGEAILQVFTSIGSTIGSTVQTIQGYWNSFVEFLSGTWEKIKQGAQGAVDSVRQLWADFLTSLTTIWETVKTSASDAWTFIKDTATQALDAILEKLEPLLGPLREAWDLAKGLASALSEAFSGGGGSEFAGAQAAARGGRIRGPGTSTSDSVPIWASVGEFMVRAAAVRKYGVSMLHAINSMRFNPDSLRYAMGGMISVPVASSSRVPMSIGGGDGGGTRRVAIDLSLLGQQFNDLLAPEDVADRLVNFAIGKQNRSTGRRPSWVGGGK